jgi:hypothetical protein
VEDRIPKINVLHPPRADARRPLPTTGEAKKEPGFFAAF